MATPGAPSEVAGKIIFSDSEIALRVDELGAAITADYSGRDLVLVTILKGGIFFLADLSRRIDLPLTTDFMAVSSYFGGSPGNVRITKDLDDSIQGRDVLIVEDIIDTGLTLNYVIKNLRSRGPASLEICTLLDKDVRRIVELPIAYRGFTVADRFLIGYGLDLRGRYRNLPFLAELHEVALL
ncbi:MAG: hypoxanthine phosphoribosyltransferase [Actinobacteria bacterium]|nr:hypoxanthine phosphoribosyltransferase [Actinomycetota bacterium]MCG2806914.1 hypoxanthine phosphoribosyltransferase [Coriobacteriia bacterium]